MLSYSLGIHSSSETSIYGTIGSHPLYLQVAILLMDAIGFESYFRGALQTFFEKKMKTGRIGAPFFVALCDASIHVISLNPLWVITTFIADSVWGLTKYYSKDVGSSMISHFVWDIVIFIIAPIT